jgi:16S rRNA (guanine966-N2)-methyltransferase
MGTISLIDTIFSCMRITGGQLRSRTLNTSGFQGIRPTTDRARETIFNILLNYCDFEAAHILDICAGTGALAFEALSRGASSAVLIEKSQKNCRLLTESATSLGLHDVVRVVCGDAVEALASLSPRSFHIIFCDPPYAAKLINPVLQALMAAEIGAKECVFVAEHDAWETVLLPQGWQKLTERHFGETIVEFFQRAS